MYLSSLVFNHTRIVVGARKITMFAIMLGRSYVKHDVYTYYNVCRATWIGITQRYEIVLYKIVNNSKISLIITISVDIWSLLLLGFDFTRMFAWQWYYYEYADISDAETFGFRLANTMFDYYVFHGFSKRNNFSQTHIGHILYAHERAENINQTMYHF